MVRKVRPSVLTGKTLKAKTNCGSLFVTLNEMDGELGEIRLNLGKTGSCIRGMLELVGILYSIILQMDIPKDEKIKLFKKHCLSISCGNPFVIGEEKYTSCLDYIGRKCLEELKDGKTTKD